jgi:hypothetical protein
VGPGGYRVPNRGQQAILGTSDLQAKRCSLGVKKDYDRLANSVGELEPVAGVAPSTFEIEKLS